MLTRLPQERLRSRFGSVTAADDATLTSTEADIIPASAITGASTPEVWHAYGKNVANGIFDGTSAALDLFINVACPDVSNSATAQTYAITGTLTITWINLGTY